MCRALTKLPLTCVDDSSLCHLSYQKLFQEENDVSSRILTHSDTFSIVTLIFKEGFNTMFVLGFMVSSTLSQRLCLPSERITQASQSGPDVCCLISIS